MVKGRCPCRQERQRRAPSALAGPGFQPALRLSGQLCSCWLKLDFDPSGLMDIKGFIGIDGCAQRLPLSNDLAGLDGAIAHQINQSGYILAMVAIPHIDSEIPIHRYANGEEAVGPGIDAYD